MAKYEAKLTHEANELFSKALDTVRSSSAEIERLESTGLASNETIDDRMRAIACHARKIATAFRTMDTIIVTLRAADRVAEKMSAEENVSSTRSGEVN